MGSSNDEKLKIAIDIEVNNRREITRLTKDLKKLGGESAVKANKEINKLNREIKMLSGETQKATPFISKFVSGIAKGNLIATATTKALAILTKGVDELTDAVVVAGEKEELGSVYEFVGQRAGFTTSQLKKYELQIQATGIAQKKSNQVLLRGLQAQLKMEDVLRLTRIAQDAAVIGQTDSSEASLALLDSVTKLQPKLLKQFGIIVDLDQAYAKFAPTLDKNIKDLTRTEKRQALLNEIFKQGTTLTGAYEKAMGKASKQQRSLNRHFEDAQIAVGSLFQDEYLFAIQTTETLLKSVTALFQTTERATEVFFAQKEKMKSTSEETITLANRYDELKSKTSLTNEEQFEFNNLLDRLSTAFPTAISSWTEYGEAIDINTGKIKTNIETQRALFRIQQADKIKEWKDAYIDLKEEMENTRIALRNVEKLKVWEGKEAQIEKLNLKIATQNAFLNDLTASLSVGFDAILNYDGAVAVLDVDMANLIRKYQQAQVAQQSFNNSVKKGVVEGFESLFPDDDFLSDAKGEIVGFEEALFDLDPAFGSLNLKMQQLERNTVQGFISMANSAKGFFDTLRSGEFSLDNLFNLAVQGFGLYTQYQSLTATAPVATGGTSPAAVSSGGGINITGNLNVTTQATSAMNMAREIENLSSRNLTNINVEEQVITR